MSPPNKALKLPPKGLAITACGIVLETSAAFQALGVSASSSSLAASRQAAAQSQEIELSFDAWLYQAHSEADLRSWATSLRFFRFCRAYGGHANDGDSFKVALRFESESELLELCRHLGVTLNALPVDEPRPIPNQRYSAGDFSQFRSAIPDLPQWEQPGRCDIHTVSAFLWAQSRALHLQLAGESGDDYSVTEADFRNALRLEAVLTPLANQIVDPPQDNRHCVCPRYYPDFWESAAQQAAEADPATVRSR